MKGRRLSIYRPSRPLLFILGCWVVFCFDLLVLSPRDSGLHHVASAVSRFRTPTMPETLANITRRTAASPTLAEIPTPFTTQDVTSNPEPLQLNEYLVAAILPVTNQSLPALQRRISSLLDWSAQLHEILLLCSLDNQAEARKALYEALSEDIASQQVDVSLLSWPATMEEGAAILHAAQNIDTPLDRILILDANGLDSFDTETRAMLVGRFATPLPVGPRGYEIRDQGISCRDANETPDAASFLVPPFSIAPLLVPPHALPADPDFDIWISLGDHISHARYEGVGGVIVDFDEQPSWCLDDRYGSSGLQEITSSREANELTGTFAVILGSTEDLISFATTICRLRSVGHDVEILLLDEDTSTMGKTNDSVHLNPTCEVEAAYLSKLRLDDPSVTPETWLADLSSAPSIVLTVPGEGLLSSAASEDLSLIQIPRADLPFCDWIATLSLEALQNWHTPQIEVSVITNDRPESLSRLLVSLSDASYFGDEIHLRINTEQTADEETLRLIDAFDWSHGAKFVHRRVVQGGLLPAVVESWYPSSNHSYGLMLEDDVELSPLFYAWAKMSLLAYRYGRREDVSPQLFGISLYQQKNLELRPEGRHTFNAQTLFSSTPSFADRPNTPYLSQIPCSWGALYFPEQWREFHDYLAVRLSSSHPSLPVDAIIAPGLRSNKWTRSWKKYFIELVYLRGYVMLYPNFDGYVSLSTNHLEVGSHVREMSREAFERKKKLYLLPLMERPTFDADNSTTGEVAVARRNTGLGDLPDGRMPSWETLPVLDLLGLFATEELIQGRGAERRKQLFDCNMPDLPLDVQALLCMEDTAEDE